MAQGKGKIKGWITKNGVHIPIYDHYTASKSEPSFKNSVFTKHLGAKWLDFAGSYSNTWNPNTDTHKRAIEYIEMLKKQGVVNKKADAEDVHQYFIHYGEYGVDKYKDAPYGKLAEGFVKYVEGATDKGYGDNKKAFDSKYGLSKFIDSHKQMQLSTNVPMYRGVRTSDKEVKMLQYAHKSKSPISMKGISSWTANKFMADGYTKATLDSSGDIRLVYKDVTKGQRNAMPWPHGGQHEAIYSDSARFDIVSIDKTKTGYEVKVKKHG